jgi:hypothetical protein
MELDMEYYMRLDMELNIVIGYGIGY